ncbi:MAG: TetR/AcrR family transcriptional regulator [Gammaproteobacteria bacterium]|nr:TetR/AcrR family transcriptional regulator [Gammaproteobacteria bacterium]
MARTPSGSNAYHHGDLRSALLAAADSLLEDRGVEGFTLRECARRAGVSHAAPAHHFKDVRGLLTAVAAGAFDRLTTSMHDRKALAPGDPLSQLQGAGEGYIAFALGEPQHFYLMFRCSVVNTEDEALSASGRAAFLELERPVAALHAVDDAMADANGNIDAVLLWSLVHGFAHLYLDGRVGRYSELDAATLAERVIGRTLTALGGHLPAKL